MTLGIPKVIGHIWIGHLPPPTEWMASWREMHPDWEYRLYDNEYLFSRRWRHQALIHEYYRRGAYAGVSDLMRYELLHEFGGFLPEADSTCVRPTDELWTREAVYTVFENEVKKPGLVSPFLAAAPGHTYMHYINLRLQRRRTPDRLGPPWRSVGNRFLAKAIKARPSDDLVIFPSHYFIPTHKTDESYQGEGPVFCEQHWGSTFGGYAKPPDGTNVRATRREHLARLEAWMTPRMARRKAA